MRLLCLLLLLPSLTLAHNFTVSCFFESDDGQIPEEIHCNGQTFYDEGRDEPLTFHFWGDLIVSVLLTLFAGAMSGLTLGLLSIDKMNLAVLLTSDGVDEVARKHAERIAPLVERHHHLLVTLLICNACSMEALPIFLDRIVGPLAAVIISVSAVLIFGEIVPQAICSQYGMAIGSRLRWLVWFLMAVTFPLSYPLAKALDFTLGTEHTSYYRRHELKALIELHETQSVSQAAAQREASRGDARGARSLFAPAKGQQAHASPSHITSDEAAIIKGALDLSTKTVGECFTPLRDVFQLPADAVLDDEVVARIRSQGHARVPVYFPDQPNKFKGILLVKSLIGLSPTDRGRVDDQKLIPVSTVPSNTPLYDLFNGFRTGKSGHLALVAHFEDSTNVLGIITIEDVIEELLQGEILDELESSYYRATGEVPRHRPSRAQKGFAALGRGATTSRVVPSSYDVETGYLATPTTYLGQQVPRSTSPVDVDDLIDQTDPDVPSVQRRRLKRV